jgi:hypothetical protein
MSTRYLSNISLAAAGAFLAVAAFAFGVSTFEWLSFAGGIAAIAISSAIVLKGRGNAQRAIDATAAAVGAWTIVESLLFSGTTITWLGFGAGAALAGLALVGLTLHELHTERVVHSIEVHDSERELAEVA